MSSTPNFPIQPAPEGPPVPAAPVAPEELPAPPGRSLVREVRPASGGRILFFVLAVPLLVGVSFAVVKWSGLYPGKRAEAAAPPTDPADPAEPAGAERKPKPLPAPELEGGVGWLNTAGPVRLKDLRGKVVLLDFWTFCCINCMHVLPDLAKLEKKYPNELVVIGVHSAKFKNEKGSDNIRKAILRYEISHPVVNDADFKIWRAYRCQSWPTLWLIDPEGNLVGYAPGEGNYELLDKVIAKLIETHKKKKTLNTKPLKFELARNQENGTSPLFFPGKVLADEAGKRLFIADSTHHRIVITDLDGKKIAVAGTGSPGKADGPFARASFNDPQGMALKGNTLYVADRKNHLIRALDLKDKTVRTVAGTGAQGRDRSTGGDALKVGLNSPWDLLLVGKYLYVAMAGHHQIWRLDLDSKEMEPYAGSGMENIRDGTLAASRFAQPSGLTTDGRRLYVADSEVSAVRSVPLGKGGSVETLVGEGLFDFGDLDTVAGNAALHLAAGLPVSLARPRLQHALGVAYHGGKLYVADTYNSKIKVIDPKTGVCKTFLGGEPEGWLATRLFYEPGGISYAAGKLYVADTNAHRVRVIDLAAKTVSTLKLRGVEAPRAAQ